MNKFVNIEKDKFEKKLVKKFKFIYRNYISENPNNHLELKCGSGWYELIWTLSHNIYKILKKNDMVKATYEFYTEIPNSEDGYEIKVWYKTNNKILARLWEMFHPEHEVCEKGFSVMGIKQEFGRLNYFTYGSISEIEKLIKRTEKKSEQICEKCGIDTGQSNLKGSNTIYNMCDKCWDIKNKNKKFKLD